MGGSFINILVVLILLSVFISRTVIRARSQNRKKQEPPRRRVPVQRVDNDVPHWERAAALEMTDGSTAAETAQRTMPKAALVSEKKAPEPVFIPAPVNTTLPVRTNTGSGAAFPGSGWINVNHLSPLKQAVVMAEILGPPKGMVL